MINVGCWMTRVKYINPYGGDSISEIQGMRSIQSIPFVYKVYYSDKLFNVSDEMILFRGPEEIAEYFLRIEPQLDIIHIRGIESFRTIRPLTDKPIIYFGTPLEHDAFEQSDAIDVFSPTWRQMLIEGHGVPEEKVFVIPQSVDINVFKPMDASHIKESLHCDHLLGYVGSTQRTYLQVNMNSLIKAFRRAYDNLTLMILTYNMQENKNLKFDPDLKVLDISHLTPKEISEYKIDHHYDVIIKGVPFDEMPMYYNAFDVTLCLGTAPMAGNMKEIEAQACGSPTVAFDMPNRRYRFGDDYRFLSKMQRIVADPNSTDPILKDGLRAEDPEYDEKDLIRKIDTLLRIPELREEVSIRNREHSKIFSTEAVGKMIMKMYKEVLK